MKAKLLITFITILLFNASKLNAQTAELQLILNSADPALAQVDVYVNDSLVANDIIFRSATQFITFPADSLLNIGIALSTSSSVNDTIKNFQITLQDSNRYVAIIVGVVDSSQFAPNPDTVSAELNILFQNNIRAAATNPANVDFIIAQGSTDLSKCDLNNRDTKKLADDLSYTGFTNYDSIAASSFTLDITPFDNDSIIKSYQIDFTGMDGSSAVLVASGFRNPVANQNGPSFEFFAVFANGSVVEFFPVSLAKLQAIHNSADPALDSIDIYALGVLAVDNFHFRTATPIFNVPGDFPLEVAIAPGNSTSINDTLKSFTITFENGKNYVAIATGVLDTSMFAPNPDGADISFTMLLQDGMRWKSQNANDVDSRFVNGVTDAPAIDVKFSGGALLVDNVPYGTITPYNSLASPGTYNFDVTDSSNSLNYNSYQAVTDSFAGQSAVTFFSGFMNPAANQNGAPYSLFAAFADSSVYELVVVTGVPKIIHQDELNLYPNPTGDFLNINLGSTTRGKSILKIRSVEGKTVYENTFNESTSKVDLRNVARGIYFIEVNHDGKVFRDKVVVE